MKTKYHKSRTKKPAKPKPADEQGNNEPEAKPKRTLGDYFLLPHLHKPK